MAVSLIGLFKNVGHVSEAKPGVFDALSLSVVCNKYNLATLAVDWRPKSEGSDISIQLLGRLNAIIVSLLPSIPTVCDHLEDRMITATVWRREGYDYRN